MTRIPAMRESLVAIAAAVAGATAVGAVWIFALRDESGAQTRNEPLSVAEQPHETHGSRQLEQLLLDRPALKEILTPDNAVSRWIVSGFDGAGLGFRVYWNPEPPALRNFPATSLCPSEGRRAEIRVRDLTKLKRANASSLSRKVGARIAEHLCSLVVFELLNLEGCQSRHTTHYRAFAGEVTRSQYIRLNAETEHQAYLALAGFFHDVWSPFARRRSFRLNPDYWGVSTPQVFDDWIELFERTPNGYPEDPFGRYFDEVIAPYLAEHGPRAR